MANGITPLSRTNMQVDNVDFLRALRIEEERLKLE